MAKSVYRYRNETELSGTLKSQIQDVKTEKQVNSFQSTAVIEKALEMKPRKPNTDLLSTDLPSSMPIHNNTVSTEIVNVSTSALKGDENFEKKSSSIVGIKARYTS